MRSRVASALGSSYQAVSQLQQPATTADSAIQSPAEAQRFFAVDASVAPLESTMNIPTSQNKGCCFVHIFFFFSFCWQ
jgi:3D (Asp-Asp-Asp) domain-containing protein